MKVTALIDDQLIKDIKKMTKAGTITESLVIVLKDWISMKHLLALSKEIKAKPIDFKSSLSAKKMRTLSRRRS